MTDRKGPSSGSLEREWIKSLKEFSESMRTRVVSLWHGTWTEKPSLPIKWVPPSAHPHTEMCLSETAFLPLSSLFLCLINRGLHDFKRVSVGAERHWTLTESSEGPCLISRALRVCAKLWAWKTKKGPRGDLRGGRKLYVNVGFSRNQLDNEEL